MRKKLSRLFLVMLVMSMIWTPKIAASTEEGTEQSTEQEKTTNILFVGNSLTKYKVGKITYTVEEPLQTLAESAGHSVNITTIAYGSAKLQYYAGLSGSYMSYHRELVAALVTGQWDYVVLQDHSKETVNNLESSYSATAKLKELIEGYQPSAKILLYMTHGYDDGTQTKINGENRYLTTSQLQEYVSAGYGYLGNKSGLDVVPVGMQFARSEKLFPNISLISDDLKHPQYAGYYLAACSFYYRIFGEVPVGGAESLKNCDLTDTQLRNLESLVTDSISLDKKAIELKSGKTATLKATVKSSRTVSTQVSWKSFDESIAKVNKTTGAVTAVSGGKTMIMATSSDGLQAVCNVTVKIPLAFGRSYYVITQGDYFAVQPKTNSESLSWTSSSKSIATVTSLGLVSGLKPGKTAITVKNKSDSSDKASYTLYVAFKAPVNIKAATTGNPAANSKYGKLKVTWKSVSGAAGYDVYRATSQNGTYTKIGTSQKNSYTDAKASLNKYYYYKIVAKNSYEYCASEKSASAKGIVLKSAALKTKVTKSGYAKLSWNKNTTATGYVIYRSTKKNSGYKKIATVSSKSTSYIDNTVKKNKKYYYRIKSYKQISGTKFYGVRSKTKSFSNEK